MSCCGGLGLEGAIAIPVVTVVVTENADVARGADDTTRVDLDDPSSKIDTGREKGDITAEAESPASFRVEADELGGVEAATINEKSVGPRGIEAAALDNISGESALIEAEGAFKDVSRVEVDSPGLAVEGGVVDGDILAERCKNECLGESIEIGAVSDRDGGLLQSTIQITT